jgi:hypothetical protein
VNVTEIRIETEEDGFWLILDGHEDEIATEYRFNIHGVAVDLLAAVEREIAPWHREGMKVLAEMKAAGAFECEDPEQAWIEDQRVVAIREDGSYRYDRDEDAYDPSDPKHRNWHSVHADLYDNREGK